MKRIFVAAILGGVIIFVWGAISHMVLPLGEMGLRVLPNEDAVLTALRTSVPEAGMYLFPGMEPGKHPTEDEQKAWAEKYQRGPVGLLVYRPRGAEVLSPRQLVTELASNVAAAALAAFLASLLPGTYLRRVSAIALLGVFAWLSISISYWNWYGFPTAFTIAEGLDQLLSFFFAGLAIAKIVPSAAAGAP